MGKACRGGEEEAIVTEKNNPRRTRHRRMHSRRHSVEKDLIGRELELVENMQALEQDRMGDKSQLCVSPTASDRGNVPQPQLPRL